MPQSLSSHIVCPMLSYFRAPLRLARRLVSQLLREKTSSNPYSYDDAEREWRVRNPEAPPNGFFIERKIQALSSGKRHATLGSNLRSGEFQESGKKEFNRLLSFGLNQNAVCVDYGCGTLRVGQHVIALLEPGKFWGFELHDAFLEKGRSLIGDSVVNEKKPNLKVISHDSIKAAADFKPTFLYSCNVMQKVSPDLLANYLVNITDLIGSWGRAYIFNTKWHGSETVRYGSSSWAHNIMDIRAICTPRGFEVQELYSKPKVVKLAGGQQVILGGGLSVHRGDAAL